MDRSPIDQDPSSDRAPLSDQNPSSRTARLAPAGSAGEDAAEQAERLRAVLDATVDGIVTIDCRGTIESVNRATERIFGYPAEELVGRNVSILMPPPYRAEHDGYLANYLRTGEAKIIGIGREVEGRRKDGATFPMSLAVGEVRLADRRMFTGIIRDLTVQKQIEEELQKRDRQVRFIVEHLPAGAVYVDLQTGEMLCNATVERITGYPRERLDTVDAWFRTLSGDDETAVRALHERMRSGGAGLAHTVNYRHADGTPRVMEVSGYRYNRHAVWLVRDVTEHREAERRAVQAERLAAIGQMVAGLAHESRNALQRAQAGLDILAMDAADDPTVGNVRKALADLTTLYEEVRQYAAPIHLQREPVSVRTIWRQAWENLATRAAEKSITMLEGNRPDDPAVCDVDPFRLGQVFRNVFENAIDASPEGAVVTVDVVSGPGHGDCLDVCVSDSGPGLDENQAARVFEPFFTTKQRGTGLGMAIVARIVDLHDGRIRIERADSGGARFRLTLERVLGPLPATPPSRGGAAADGEPESEV